MFVNEPAKMEPGTPAAVLELARANNAKVMFLDVAASLPRTFINMEEGFRKARQARLESMIAGLDTAGVEIEYSLREGIPMIEIVREVLENGHDVVIKNSDGRHLHSAAFGSIDMQLLRKCPCPVWIVTSNKSHKANTVMACIDVDEAVAANAELNQKILEMSGSLARMNKATLHVVHALAVPHELYRGDVLSVLGDVELGNLIEDLQEERQAEVSALIEKHCPPGVEVRVHISQEPPDELILSVAFNNDIDVVVMGTVARTGVAGFFIGNTAERVINGLTCSVLTVKPDAFQTPVQ